MAIAGQHADALAQALDENARLRAQLQRTVTHLALLSDVNHQLTGASSLDEILDATPLLPQRLVPAQAAALVLFDGERPIIARTTGDQEYLARNQLAHGLPNALDPQPPASSSDGRQLVLRLHDGRALIGWIELYRSADEPLADDELALLETIAGEIAEAISGARRRAQEALDIYQLERAIAEERARIARDIHDGIAQTLAFRRMRIDLWLDWQTSDPGRLRDELIQLKQVLRDQIAELRRAIFALRPIQFDELGFSAGLQRYVLEFAEQQGWQVDVDLSGVPTHFAPELEAVCFRIVQEALTNAAKHAAATTVLVTLMQVESTLQISVRDDGRGYDPNSGLEDRPGHIGLRQMRERVLALNGRLEIRTHPGEGTEVRAWLPFVDDKR